MTSFSLLQHWLRVNSPKGTLTPCHKLFPQKLPPRDSIYKGFKGRSFPGEVVQIPSAVWAWCVNTLFVLLFIFQTPFPLSGLMYRSAHLAQSQGCGLDAL